MSDEKADSLRTCLKCHMYISGGFLCDGCEAAHFSNEERGTGPVVMVSDVLDMLNDVLCDVPLTAARADRVEDLLGPVDWIQDDDGAAE